MIKQFFILIGFIGALYLFSPANACLADANNKKKELEIKRSLASGPLLRSSTIPYQVFLTSFSIDVTIESKVGTVAVSVVNESGSPVYETEVDSQQEVQFSIPIFDWEEGRYTLTLVDESGTSWFGDFEI